MKVAIITGASSGMGKWFAICSTMYFTDIEEVWLLGRNLNRLSKVGSHINVPVKIIPMDFNNEASIIDFKKILLKENPDIRLLVNSAGLGYIGRFDVMDSDDVDAMINVNCKALTSMINKCIPFMHKNSRIINLSSAAAFVPQPEFAVYAATKSYVLSLSEALAKELRRRKIYVTAVCPGTVDTPFIRKASKYKQIKPYKRLFMTQEKCIVHHALWDSKLKKSRSVYGFFINIFYLLCKFLPLKLLFLFM